MNAFTDDWLALREPLDHTSRNRELLALVREHLANFQEPLILDLACGTGSTFRAFRQAGIRARWVLVDNDNALISRAEEACQGEAVEVLHADVTNPRELVSRFKPDLVTTSAFLDLASRSWLGRLAETIVTGHISFYAALTYDGRIKFPRQRQLDDWIVELVNQHQLGDKGLGSALGPLAAEAVKDIFTVEGYTVKTGASDWVVQSGHPKLYRELLKGWAVAAQEMAVGRKDEIASWLDDRLCTDTTIIGDEPWVIVGHRDVFTCPA